MPCLSCMPGGCWLHSWCMHGSCIAANLSSQYQTHPCLPAPASLQLESSQHAGSIAAAALAAGFLVDEEGRPALEQISPFARLAGT